jgi:hypothetical protein
MRRRRGDRVREKEKKSELPVRSRFSLLIFTFRINSVQRLHADQANDAAGPPKKLTK